MTLAKARAKAPNAFERPLAMGEPITYWRLGDTVETRFDVADCPMHGEMDPFFFLTKQKNFIPHQYPCRTEWIAQKRDRRPEPAPRSPTTRFWLPFGSPRVDLSGFWFRPTSLRTWAETQLFAGHAGQARMRLSTCGGAIIYVNDEQTAWLAPYERNLEHDITFDVPLRAGVNNIAVFFDDLAERDARYYFELEYLSGPSLVQQIQSRAEPELVGKIENLLEGMHFSKSAYMHGPVVLVGDTALSQDAAVSVRIEGDFMSSEYLEIKKILPAGETRINLGETEDLPADFRHFHVEISVEGFAASRTFAVEICHARRQGNAPRNLADRIREALGEVAAYSEADSVRALACLATDQSGPQVEAMIANILTAIEDCHDCADFALVPLLWSRIRYAQKLAPDLLVRIDRAILNFRYWMDEPGNDVQWYFSENHALLFHTAAYLAGDLFPNETFARSQRAGREQSSIGAARVRAWLDHFERWEMAEFNSAPYFPIDLKGLTALYALSPDADISKRAGRAIARLLGIVARSAHHGALTAAQGRSYEHTLCATGSLELSAMVRLVWGHGFYGRRMHALPQLALCLRDHGLELTPKDEAIASLEGDDAQEWVFAQGPERLAKLYHYKTRDYAMGSAAHYRWGEWGYQETVLHARLGRNPNAQMWINHPGEHIHYGFGRPSFWGGSATLPRVQQYRDLALVGFSGSAGQVPFTHAWFPIAEFDACLIENDWAAALVDGAMIFIKAASPLFRVDKGPTAGVELRQAGLTGAWRVRLGRRERFGSLDQFARTQLAAATSMPQDENWCVQDPQYGAVQFRADGQIEAEGRVLDPSAWSIAGHARLWPAEAPATPGMA